MWRTERSGVSNTNLRALVGRRVVFNTRANFVSVAILGQRRALWKEFGSLMACHEARSLLRWEVKVSDELKENLVQWLRRATIWSQHLWRYRPVFVKPVTPAQVAKTVVANGAAVLTFLTNVGERFSSSNVSSVLTTSQSSRGCAFASVHPAHKTLVDLFRRVRYIVCSAAAAIAGSWSCVGKRVCSRIHVVVCSYCRCVWDRGRCAFSL